jgi:DNA modification methylase
MLLHNGSEYHIHPGDCITHLGTMPARSIDMMIFSPPFPALYAYTSLPEDIGNSEDLRTEAKLHLGFFYHQLSRVLKPGRVAIVHVMQIPRMKRAGSQGLFDFRGLNIRLAERAGLVFEYDWVVRKNPQEQALRTKSRELQFAGLESDRARSRGVLPDYLLKFTALGENETRIESKDQVSRNDWIAWAECTWEARKYPIDERDTLAMTLNTAVGKGQDDTKHICPLQLSVIDRCVRLFTNPGELVFSPFAGIGSEGFVALRLGRQFYGCEIKPEYRSAAISNLDRAIRMRNSISQGLLAGLEIS